MRQWMAWLLVGLAGCVGGADDDARWHADERFTAEERVEVERAVAWLSAVSGHDVGGVAFDHRVGQTPQPFTIRRERGPYGEAGATGVCHTGWGGPTVYLDTNDAAPYLAAIAAHELAHCEMGLADDHASDGIMRVLEPMRWTDREATQCAASEKCR